MTTTDISAEHIADATVYPVPDTADVPLTNAEMRELLTLTRENAKRMDAFSEFITNAPAMMENAPPMMKMAMKMFLPS